MAMEDPGRAEQLTGRKDLESNKGKANSLVHPIFFWWGFKYDGISVGLVGIRFCTVTASKNCSHLFFLWFSL